MAILLGSTTKPTATQEWFGLNVQNQHAYSLTLPAGGPWRILTVGVWCAGKDSSPTSYLCVWSAAGVTLAQSASFTLASRSFGVGNSDLYEKAMNVAPTVAGGVNVLVGFARAASGAAQFGKNSGTTNHYDHTAATVPADFTGETAHATGSMGAYLYYEAANSLPNAPTLNSPANGALVNYISGLNVELNFTPSDPDGDTHTLYNCQIDDTSDMSSPIDSTDVYGSFADGVAINHINTVALSRGVPYYWRAITADAVGVGPWSAIRSFSIISLPTASVTAPRTLEPAELYYVAGSNTTPKIRYRWSYSCPDGHAQASVSLKLYADSAGSPGALLDTQVYTGAALTVDGTYAVAENTLYHASVTPTCSAGAVGAESAKIKHRVRWARASYFYATGITPTSIAVAAATTTNATSQVVLEYAATTSTAEPGAWYENISSSGLPATAHLWHRATMFAWGSAAPTSPTLNSVTLTYGAIALILDHWTVAAGAVVDTGAKVYGTQSLKATANGTTRRSFLIVKCEPNTTYRLQGRIWTVGVPTGRLEVLAADGSVILGDAVAVEPTDATQTFGALPVDNNGRWRRYATPAFNSGSATSLRIDCSTAGASGTANFDALKLEASAVVTPWTPGFIGAPVILDAGGVIVDGSAGGTFRLKGSAGGSSDVVDLGPHGLRLNSLGISNGTAFPSSPAIGERCFRTDYGMEFYYDGTRWLSVTQFTLPYDRKVYSASGYSEEQFVMRPSGLGYWVTGCYLNLNVITTHSNTNKWTLETYDEAAGVRATMPDSWATAPAVGTSYHQFNALGYANNASVNGERSRLKCTKVGAPGNLSISAAISYRLIAT